MNELATIEQQAPALQGNEQSVPALLDGLAREARTYAENAALYMLQLGRVLTQAKELIPFGDFTAWVEGKVGINERYGQLCMNSYAKYGESPEFAKLGKSKLLKMLSLPAGTHEDFVKNNDVENMTVREVGEAVKKAREQERAAAEKEIESERRARRAAEARADELANRPPEIPEEVADDLREKDEEIKRLVKQAQDAIDRANSLQREKSELQRERDDLKRDCDEADALIVQTKKMYDESQRKLQSLQSAAAQEKVDSDPMNEKLTLEAFTDAVHRFTGACSPFPCMAGTFSAMDSMTRNGFDLLLRTVEDWCRRSRAALDTTSAGRDYR